MLQSIIDSKIFHGILVTIYLFLPMLDFILPFFYHWVV